IDALPLTPPATTPLCTLSLHDALPIFLRKPVELVLGQAGRVPAQTLAQPEAARDDRTARARDDVRADLRHLPLAELRKAVVEGRSEEHTSELQSLAYLVCRLLLEKKNA